MQPFELVTPAGVAEAIELGAAPGAVYLAGGTNVVDFLRTGAMSARTVVDIEVLPLRGVEFDGSRLRIGALARMSDVAAESVVLQRTRCPYFRDRDFPCNKRRPGSGCAALQGENRRHAVLGGSDCCVAAHASDLAVALVAAGAEVHVQGPAGERTMLLDTFYREPGSTPHIETSIDHGDLVVAVSVPALPGGGRSVYLKVRERASYEFALVSVAASAEVEDGVIGEARVALGGVATRPWRARETEAMLAGVALDDRAAMREAASAAFADARPLRDNTFKMELGTRAIVRALRQAGGAG